MSPCQPPTFSNSGRAIDAVACRGPRSNRQSAGTQHGSDSQAWTRPEDAKARGPDLPRSRPQIPPFWNFSTLIGQAPMVRTLTNAFLVRPASRSLGCLTGACAGWARPRPQRFLARALNYKKRSDRPSRPSELSTPGVHCEAIMEGGMFDVTRNGLRPRTPLDNMRDCSQTACRYSPVSRANKVLHHRRGAHAVSGGAFNAILKTLKKPPPPC